MKTKLTIIIPAYNEGATIGAVLDKVQNVDCGNLEKEIIVIDDGSSDDTREILLNCKNRFNVIFHERNFGKGKSIQDGLSKATGDYVVIQDADLEYDPVDWLSMLKLLKNREVVAVYGSRNLGLGQRGYLSYALGGKFITFLANTLFHTKLTDINTGYKLFRKSVLDTIKIKSSGFEFCEEITAKLLKNGFLIKEVPIHYYPRTFKQGKKIRLLDGLMGIFTLLRYRVFN